MGTLINANWNANGLTAHKCVSPREHPRLTDPPGPASVGQVRNLRQTFTTKCTLNYNSTVILFYAPSFFKVFCTPETIASGPQI